MSTVDGSFVARNIILLVDSGHRRLWYPSFWRNMSRFYCGFRGFIRFFEDLP